MVGQGGSFSSINEAIRQVLKRIDMIRRCFCRSCQPYAESLTGCPMDNMLAAVVYPPKLRPKHNFGAAVLVSVATLVFWCAFASCFASMSLPRSPGESKLARQITFTDAWKPSAHSRFCCLIYATQNGWKLPILFEELQFPYDWCLVDFERNEQKSPEFLKINPNGRIPALIDREKNVAVAESGAIVEYVCETLKSDLFPSMEVSLEKHLQCKQWMYWQVSALGPMMGDSSAALLCVFCLAL